MWIMKITFQLQTVIGIRNLQPHQKVPGDLWIETKNAEINAELMRLYPQYWLKISHRAANLQIKNKSNICSVALPQKKQTKLNWYFH